MPHARLPTARLTLTATQVNALTAVSYAVTLTILRLHPPESAAPIYLFGLCQLPPCRSRLQMCSRCLHLR